MENLRSAFWNTGPIYLMEFARIRSTADAWSLAIDAKVGPLGSYILYKLTTINRTLLDT